MKVIEFSRYGIPHEVCACVEADDPGPPAAGEIVVSIDACSINPADLLIIEGRYPGPASLPSRLGIEGVGRVLAVADNVQEISPGDRVMLLDRENWAERVATPANRVIRISSGKLGGTRCDTSESSHSYIRRTRPSTSCNDKSEPPYGIVDAVGLCRSRTW